MVSELHDVDRATEILLLLKQGSTREDLASKYGHSDYRSVDAYMRRKNYTWSPEMKTYIQKEGIISSSEVHEVHTGKALQILDLFSQGLDAKSIATKLFFTDHRSLADYMKQKGYKWSLEERNYEKISGLQTNDVEDFKTITASEIVEQIPRYLIPGIPQGKNIHMSHLLNSLIVEFSREKNIKQREIFETAIIDFLQKYGYVHEIKALFKSK
ncbi:hypothetical protein PGH26_02030 [Sporosarcina jeotgali]|uniref:Uncharacterized protein n=1 Tax=Sporosarcina jeotgali TaxID=3020056 RepID=A0ABZ0KWF2_9BACL|nr:hypothetical protein [Sporosarcina sp. B2O-1]WOV84727.1 hypothetical protein PGH26_02030 [Sporosarcina sp. B2O-1]